MYYRDAIAAFRELFVVLFGGAGIIILFFWGVFSLGDRPLFDFSSYAALGHSLFRLLKALFLIGAAFALVMKWVDYGRLDQEVDFLRRRLEGGDGERDRKKSAGSSMAR
jgi:hypothetical protein